MHSSADRPLTAAADSFHSRLMLWLLLIAIACTCWLISAGQGTEEGHIPWKAGSALRFLTTLMTLDFQYPTRQGVEIKWLVQGVATSLALWIAAAGWCARLKERREWAEVAGSATTPAERRGPAPATIAAVAFVLLAAWSMLSATWSVWPAAALGEGIRYAIFVLWAVAIAATLKRVHLSQAAAGIVVILALTAALGIWYFHERDPNQRLKFPIGNPIFLGSCLLPAIALSLAGCWRAWLRLNPYQAQFEPHSSADKPRADEPPAWPAYLTLVAYLAALIVLSTALKLTGSRGPQLGLIIGFAVAAVVMLARRYRRWVVIGLLIGAMVGAIYVQTRGYPTIITRRMDTVMLRAYAWSYAAHLFAQNPILGQGQAGYVLASQHLSMPDAEFNPIVFPGSLMGHAHNEWIEILSDLGLVGFGLLLTGLIATFWCGVRALRRPDHPADRLLAMALLAAFTGIVAAEATGVGLRMAGLPMIFYSVVGCLWAIDRREQQPETAARTLSSPFARGTILATATLAAAAILLISVRDWQGALMEQRALTSIDRRQWQQALNQADYAAGYRLSVEARLAAEVDYTAGAHMAAAHRFQQLRAMLERQAETPKLDGNILALLNEDIAEVGGFVQACVDRGQQLLQRMPSYPGIALRMGEALLTLQDTQTLVARLGVLKEARDFATQARTLINQEYERNPLDAQVALRLLQLSRNEPIDKQLVLLLPPLRSGPVSLKLQVNETPSIQEPMAIDLFGELGQALASLVQKPGCDEAIEQLVNEAQETLRTNERENCLQQYTPEALRLAARVRMLRDDAGAAVNLAKIAAEVSTIIAPNFPEAPSNALVDLAGYTLLAEPEQPDHAVATALEALAQNRGPYAANRVGRLKRYLAFLQLAAGDEPAARQTLTETLRSPTPEELETLVNRGLLEVCRNALDAWPAAQRPSWFAARVDRLAERMPGSPDVVVLHTILAAERNDDTAVASELERLAAMTKNPAELSPTLQYLNQRFPDNQPIREFIDRLQAAASQPGDEEP